eukprot:2144378-Amphidinium_carterae.1
MRVPPLGGRSPTQGQELLNRLRQGVYSEKKATAAAEPVLEMDSAEVKLRRSVPIPSHTKHALGTQSCN